MSWDDTKKAQAVELYKEANPTSENSMDIVHDIAEQMEESPNGVRMILVKAGVYIKKDQSAAKSQTTKSTGNRVSKEAAHNALIAAIEEFGGEPDTEIISKLTGKAAIYFVNILKGTTDEEE